MDTEIMLPAKSSNEDKSYRVTFTFKNEKLSVKCNCQAGRFGNFCKHKLGLLKGQEYWLHDDADEKQWEQFHYVADWVQASKGLEYIISLSKCQKVIDNAEEELKAIRKEFALLMKTGIPAYNSPA